MKIETAITLFRRGKSQFSPADIATIQEVVDSLLVDEFQIIHKDYVSDITDVVHIHATMVVARQSFSGAENRGEKPYVEFQYMRRLSKWRGK